MGANLRILTVVIGILPNPVSAKFNEVFVTAPVPYWIGGYSGNALPQFGKTGYLVVVAGFDVIFCNARCGV
jgi:hypothetical protein